MLPLIKCLVDVPQPVAGGDPVLIQSCSKKWGNNSGHKCVIKSLLHALAKLEYSWCEGNESSS